MSTYGHGPTEREQQILDLFDADVGADEIAKRLGMSIAYVKARLSELAAPKLVDWQSPAAAASASLLAAIRKHHPERCARPGA